MVEAGVSYASIRGGHYLVTGGGSGIGLACVEALLAQGATVSAADIDTSTLERLATADGLAIAEVDITDPEAVRSWVAAETEPGRSIDGLIASAGIEPEDDAATDILPIEAWRKTLEVNLTGTFLSCREVVGAMLKGGGPASVVIVGSPTGYYGLELGHHAYSASKGGTLGLARVMAAEYAPRGIRVNVVWPGLIDTPLNDFVTRDPRKLADEVAQIPQGRMGRPSEIAAMALFLLSDQSSYCSGGIFTVDGGLTG